MLIATREYYVLTDISSLTKYSEIFFAKISSYLAEFFNSFLNKTLVSPQITTCLHY